MRVPFVDLKAQLQSIHSEVQAAVQRVIMECNFVLGHEVAEFERAFADYVGARGAVGVASGTAALHLALKALRIGPGDEVITTSLTFAATAEAILHAGARPVFVDIDPDTMNLDPDAVRQAITPRTRAVLPVHLYGQPANMEELLSLASHSNLWLIEDAAQAHGASYRGRRCGTMGHLGCFSFYPGKNLGAYGDGGAVTSNDETLLERVRMLRDHGRVRKYVHDELGYGERLDAIQAAILKVKLRYLDQWNDQRRQHAKRYNKLLAGLPVVIPIEIPKVHHVYHLYVIRTPQRNELAAYLRERGIATGIHYPLPVHRQPALHKLGYSDVELPNTDRAAEEVISLPMFPELKREQMNYVVDQMREYFHAS